MKPPTLHPYQHEWLKKITALLRRRDGAVMAQLATGGGKTICFSSLAANLARRNHRTIILTHRRELIRQHCVALARFGIRPAILAPDPVVHQVVLSLLDHGAQIDPASNVFVASIPTLAHRGRCPQADLVVVDEAHHSSARGWDRVLRGYMAQGAMILGVSATPERLDGRGLSVAGGGIFQHLVLGKPIGELTEQGYLAPLRVYAPPEQVNTEGISHHHGDFDKRQMAYRASKITGDVIAHYKRYLSGQTAICFCASVDHAEQTAADFTAAGIPSASVDGAMTDSIRALRMDELQTGRIMVLCSCDLISEGLDVPSVGGIISLRGTESRGLWYQQLGRAMRTAPGKEQAVVLDHAGNTFRHPHPYEKISWRFDGDGSEEEDEQTGGLSVRRCDGEGCFAVFPRNAAFCPACGKFVDAPHGRIPKVIAGELREYPVQLEFERWAEIAGG